MASETELESEGDNLIKIHTIASIADIPLGQQVILSKLY